MIICPRCKYVEERKGRSGQQNKYYWAVVIELLSEHTGFTQDEMHEVLKHKFLRRNLWVKTKNGEEQSIIAKSTTDLTTKEMEEYLSQIRIWASMELGVWLPEPHEEAK